MLGKNSVRSRLTAMCLIGMVLAIACGGAGLASLARNHDSLERTIEVASAARHHALMDMYHDTLRADIFGLVVSEDAAERREMRKAVDEDAGELRGNLAEVKKCELGAEIAAALDEVQPALEAYVARCEQIADLAVADPAAARRELPKFEEAFRGLEEPNGACGELIEAVAAAQGDVARGVIRAAAWSIGAVALAGMAFLAWYARRTARAIVLPIERSMTALEAVAQGDLSCRVDVGDDAGTELSRMANALDRALQGIREALHAEQVDWVAVARQREEVERLTAMTASATSAMVYVDSEGIVRAMNPASGAMLRRLEKHLPPRERMMGQPVATMFGAAPEFAAALATDPAALPARATVEIGPEAAEVAVNAIRGSDGRLLGRMVSYEIVTEKRHAEQEMARVMAMTSNATIGMLYADNDGTIGYLNPAAQATLKKLADTLPAAPEALLGLPVELLFGGNPEFRSAAAAPLASLPRALQVEISGEHLAVTVSPIAARDGRALGRMVSFERITDKVENERRVQLAATREREQARELQRKVEQIVAVVESAAKGDLRQEIALQGDDAIGQVGSGLSRFLQDLRKSIGAIARTSQGLATAAEQLRSVSRRMGSTSKEASTQADQAQSASSTVNQNVQSMATSSDQMSASVHEIARNAAEAARIAAEAVSSADSTNATIGKLSESSNAIGQVVKVITSIAEQTNLLALNATIEAARAGEAGKGFAVVAQEVKQLANATGKATGDIARRIEAIQQDVQSSVGEIGQITQVIRRIHELQQSIAGAVEEQSATTKEISRSATQAAQSTNAITQNIATVAKATTTTTSDAGDTLQAAEALSGMAEELEQLVGTFEI
ncbi:MAG: HAMP domain-containing protein [Planctomycetes bacterium]|nr:HAMP domain-containing protein [Planctomycetota bacterium]